MVHVRVLGGFAVAVDGRDIGPNEWPSRRAVELVALLAMASGHRLRTDQVIEALWSGLDADAGRANLHKAATYARRALGHREAITLRRGGVELFPGRDVAVDAVDFEAEAHRTLAADDAARCEEVADGYPGDLLPDFLYEDWTAAPRERLQRLHRDLLRRAQRWADLVELDPLDEEAHRGLMAEHHRHGRLHAAIRQFHRLRAILVNELGAAPDGETLRLYRSIVGTSPVGWIRPALVGREVELVRARAALRRATEDRPAAIVVTGPAGIGKTRLGEELADNAAASGWFVLRAAAIAETGAVPYGLLTEALESAILQHPAIADRLNPNERQLLVRLGQSPSGDAISVHRHGILRLVHRVVSAAGAARAALFLDDLHLADEATLEIAGVLASAPPPRGLLLIGSYRSELAPPALRELTESLVAAGVAVEIELAGLSRHETDLIVEDLVGRVPSPDETEAAWAISEGNPFLALELAASLASDHVVGRPSVADLLTARLERVSASARAALRAVALVTDEFGADVVAAVAGMPADAALGVIEEGVEIGVVANAGNATYRFRHNLLREGLTRDATGVERRSAEGSFADLLASEGAPAARVAQHLLGAERRTEAVPFLRAAARSAIALGAHRDAASLADTALSAVPGDPELLALRADALFGAGDPGAAAAYAVAIAASPEDDRGTLAVSRARALVLSGDIPAALETLDGVDAAVPAETQYLVTRGLALWCMGSLDDAADLGQQARRTAEQSGSLRDFVDAVMLQAMIAHERGEWPRQAAFDLLDAQLRPDLATVVMDAHLCIAESYLYGGVPYADVIAFASELRATAARTGTVHAEAFAMTLLGEAHLLTGALEPAKQLLADATALHRSVGVLCGEALSQQRLAEAYHASGDASSARAALAEALLAARGSPMGARHLLDRVHGTAIRIAPDQRAALAAVDETAHAVRGPLESCPPCSINRTIPSAIACAVVGDTVRAREFLQAAEQVADAFHRQGAWQAALDETRSHVARAEGEADVAERLLRQAADGFTRAGHTLDAQRCHDHLTDRKV